MAEIFADFHIRPSEIVLLLAGISLLVGLPFLRTANFTFWTLSKALYFLGVVLFFADK